MKFPFMEKRETTETDSNAELLESIFSNNDTITAQDALQIPAVNAALNYITGIVSALPVRMYRKDAGKSEEIEGDYRLKLLNTETGDLLDSNQFKTALVRDYFLNGSGFAYVNWHGTEIQSLNYVENNRVSYMKNSDPIFKTVKYLINGVEYNEFQIMRVLRNSRDGVIGSGIVQENPQFLSAMVSAIQYENKSVKTGGKRGFLKSVKPLKDEALMKLKTAWARLYSSTSSDTVVLLNNGLEFQDAGTTAVETQLNENKLNNSEQLYKIFGIPAAVMAGNATENELRNTVNSAIKPVTKALENAFNRFLLLETEKDSIEFIIDLDEIDTASILTRYQAYEIAVRNGWMQLDEVRYEEGRNLLGLDFIKLGLDSVIYDPKTKEMYTPNTKESYTLDGQNGDNADDGENVLEGGEEE